MVMRWLSFILGFAACFVGIQTVRRDREGRFRGLHILVNEYAWIAALVGVFAGVLGILRQPRMWPAVILGAIGTGASLRSVLVFSAVQDDMQRAMRAGLGQYYLAEISAAALKRVLPTPWSFANSLNTHSRQSRARIIRDVPFASPDGTTLKLDVYMPLVPPVRGERYPAIIALHVGGWRNGDKGMWFENHHRYLANQGYVVFDVQYRLSATAKWPAQLEDVQHAVRWVRYHAEQYQVDPERIALLGRSAGGHLALQAALRASDPMAGVRCVVALYAPTDLQAEHLTSDSPVYQLMGGSYEELPDAYRDASAIEWAADDQPAILLIDGLMDTLVSRLHSEKMMDRFAPTNTRIVSLRIPWSRHGFDAVVGGMGAQLAQYHMDRFLAWNFYRTGEML
jgi:acetyl esterase/lipase